MRLCNNIYSGSSVNLIVYLNLNLNRIIFTERDNHKKMNAAVVKTTEMHTGGQPLRIAVSGYPDIIGDTILDKRRYVKENLDHLRKILMHEPRGHKEMYGVIPVKADIKEADMGVLFMHNEG